ncbi:PTS fructose transporter subunit IIB [Candidatus Arsenophonus triatominarum]|uniref:PTS fructose transporter subunit IIB n=1 Tax=Candidatus Arsenophonus triatominarum TaxID=57911 RepID=UPI0007C54D25|nr:fructose PTS transporter subunit IIB [Candidatus Arsenophonus triatominarum]
MNNVNFTKPAAAKNQRVLAVTACPTGVAHTFMAAEALEIEAKKRGWQIKVETHGSVGTAMKLAQQRSMTPILLLLLRILKLI